MKKGKIKFIVPKSWTNPEGKTKNFWEFGIEDDPITYSNWQDQFSLKKVGDEVEFEAEQKGQNWKAVLAGTAKPMASGGGYRPMSPEQQAIEKLKLRCQLATMSASYAKDIVVAQMAKEPLPIGTIRAMFSEVAEQIHHFCVGNVKEV
jgi:hypothetical protein